jgi:hypothetical protein
MRSAGTVAEYNFTGIATSPKERVRDAMEWVGAGMGSVCHAQIEGQAKRNLMTIA